MSFFFVLKAKRVSGMKNAVLLWIVAIMIIFIETRMNKLGFLLSEHQVGKDNCGTPTFPFKAMNENLTPNNIDPIDKI